MKIDNETGNITHVDYESYEMLKEEFESKIEKLTERSEDLEYDNEQLNKQLIEARENIEFLINFIHEHQKLTDLILKKRFTHWHE